MGELRPENHVCSCREMTIYVLNSDLLHGHSKVRLNKRSCEIQSTLLESNLDDFHLVIA